MIGIDGHELLQPLPDLGFSLRIGRWHRLAEPSGEQSLQLSAASRAGEVQIDERHPCGVQNDRPVVVPGHREEWLPLCIGDTLQDFFPQRQLAVSVAIQAVTTQQIRQCPLRRCQCELVGLILAGVR